MSPADPEVSLKGKNIIVTGANTSLGFEAAVKFAALGTSEVILGIRDITKSDHAKSVIEQRTGKKDQVKVWQLDMKFIRQHSELYQVCFKSRSSRVEC